jgi:hypothetical protein
MNVPNQALTTRAVGGCTLDIIYLETKNQKSENVGVLPNPVSASHYKTVTTTRGSAFKDFNLPLDKVDHVFF